jgi:hypothetical protein
LISVARDKKLDFVDQSLESEKIFPTSQKSVLEVAKAKFQVKVLSNQSYLPGWA